MKFLLVLLLCLTGCATTYHAERSNPDTGSYTVLDVKSYREFPGGIVIDYDAATGTFRLNAGEVADTSADAMRDVILGVLPLIDGG